jgi:hypothetical protein
LIEARYKKLDVIPTKVGIPLKKQMLCFPHLSLSAVVTPLPKGEKPLGFAFLKDKADSRQSRQ